MRYFCPNCGCRIEATQRSCHKCGYVFREVSQPEIRLEDNSNDNMTSSTGPKHYQEGPEAESKKESDRQSMVRLVLIALLTALAVFFVLNMVTTPAPLPR